MRVAILTISDAGARGERADTLGRRDRRVGAAPGTRVAARALVPDETARIVAALLALVRRRRRRSRAHHRRHRARAARRHARGDARRARARGAGHRRTDARASRRTRSRARRSRADSPECARGRSSSTSPARPAGVADGLAALEPIVDHAVAIVRGDATEHGAGEARMKVLLTLTTSSRRCASTRCSRQEGVDTALVIPLDDMRAALKREKPDVIVLTGELTEPANVALVRRAALGAAPPSSDSPTSPIRGARAPARARLRRRSSQARRTSRKCSAASAGCSSAAGSQRDHGLDRRERRRCAK